MKKRIYIILISLFIAGMGCSDDNEKDTIIPTIDYVLGSNFSWKDLEKEKIYKTDSEEELLKLVEGEGENTKVDFEKYTLIVVAGLNMSTIECIGKVMTISNAGKYFLSIEVISGAGTALTPWAVAIQVPKITKSEKIELETV